MARSPWRSRLLAAAALILAGCVSGGPLAGTDEEEVNVGYGTVPASETTGAVSRVEADDIAQTSARTLEEVLAGRVPGLRVETLPNGRHQITIRGQNSIFGSNEPLYVVDGVVLFNSAGGLSGINPSDIESVEVLRGGGAAIYGSQGANGVILITTKRGRR